VVNSRHLLEDTGADLPKDLNTVCPLLFCIYLQYYWWGQAITRYIKGLCEKDTTVKGGDPKPTKVKPVYSIRDVIKQHYRELVEAEIPYKPTDKEYIGSYQRAVTTVLKNMSEQDVEEAEEIVESWNKQGAPAEVQLKWVVIMIWKPCSIKHMVTWLGWPRKSFRRRWKKRLRTGSFRVGLWLCALLHIPMGMMFRHSSQSHLFISHFEVCLTRYLQRWEFPDGWELLLPFLCWLERRDIRKF